MAERFTFLFGIVFCSVHLFLCSAVNNEKAPVAQTRYGLVQGMNMQVRSLVSGQKTVSAFLGIPYALPPTKLLRYTAPQPPVSWEPHIKTVTEFGPSCMHDDDTYFPGFPGAEMWNAPNAKSEDCLYLNVWTPVAALEQSQPAAVMVWIYGGSFFSGTSALPVYDGRYLATSGYVVVVSMNYRLGPLGFLPPLNGETPGNVGMLDQQFALRWVQENIGNFGGDPNRVTLFGESAGAASVGLHTVAPSSQGLFHRVILQSGNQITPWSTVTRDVALNRTRQMAANLNCPFPESMSEKSLLHCLRKSTAAQVFAASWVSSDIFDFPFVPVVGTSFLPEDPIQVTRRGKQSEVDILAGYNTNEGSYFSIYSVQGFNISTQSLITYNEYVNGIKVCGLRTTELGENAATFFYANWTDPQSPTQYRDGINELIGDFHIVCPTQRLAKIHSKTFPNNNVYLYHFDYRISTNTWPKWAGVMHGYEIELVFGLPWFGNFQYARNYSDIDRSVSTRMMRYWTDFAKFGNPNAFNERTNSTMTSWPKYDGDARRYLNINAFEDVARQPTGHAFECAFWKIYVPELQLATKDLNEAEIKWKIGFKRWSRSMDSWERSFNKYQNPTCDED